MFFFVPVSSFFVPVSSFFVLVSSFFVPVSSFFVPVSAFGEVSSFFVLRAGTGGRPLAALGRFRGAAGRHKQQSSDSQRVKAASSQVYHPFGGVNRAGAPGPGRSAPSDRAYPFRMRRW